MRIAIALLLFCASPSFGQSVKLPAEIRGSPGVPIPLEPVVEGGTVVWLQPDPGLSLFPAAFFGGTNNNAIVVGATGRYRLWAVVAKDSKVAKAECLVVIGNAPPVPPGPGPMPPGPNPPDPTPSPAPIPLPGFRVLIVYQTEDALSAAQHAILTSAKVREYLNAKCVKGADGKTAEWRLWDADVQGVENDAAHWGAAMRRVAQKTADWKPTRGPDGKIIGPTKPLPWILISDGRTGHEDVLPANVNDTLELLKKYGGN